MLSDRSRPVIEATLPLVAENIQAIAGRFYQHIFAAQPELLDGIFNRGNQAERTQQRARQTFHQANVTEIQERALRGDLISREGALRVLQALALAMKGHLDRMPAILHQRHPGLERPVLATAEELIRDALAQVAISNLPAEYRAPIPEVRDGDLR